MMDPMMGPLVSGYEGGHTIMGYHPSVMGAARPGLHLPTLHAPAWRAQPMGAPGHPLPTENRKILPLQPETGSGVFAAVTDRIRFSARPQKSFLGERPVFTVIKTGANAIASQVIAAQFIIGTTPQVAEVAEFAVEDLGPGGLDLNMKMDPTGPGGHVFFDLFLVGPAFVPGADSIRVFVKIYGRIIG